jgi:hypothetical protein
VTGDDLLAQRPENAKRSVTDTEVVTLCVAQAIMGIRSDRRFLAVASKHLRDLFVQIPAQSGYFKRRRRLSDTLEWPMSEDRGELTYSGSAADLVVGDRKTRSLAGDGDGR